MGGGWALGGDRPASDAHQTTLRDMRQVSDALVARDALWAAATASDGICICAPSFPAFIYRFWIENEITMKLYGDVETLLTDAERGYLEH